MKLDTILVLAAAGLGVYVVTQMMSTPARASTASSLNNGGNVNMPSSIKQIFNTALPGQNGWGWTYYTDGTAIGPDGSYYANGQKVWSPT